MIDSVTGPVSRVTVSGMIHKNPCELDGVPDMSMLIYLDGANIVHNLRCRYDKDAIYTSMSKVLIAINPYHELNIYSQQNIEKYAANEAGFNALPPHVFAVASEAYRGMCDKYFNQSVIVCGESGSGKTENAKYLMRHLATTSGAGYDGKIEQQILAANQILEGFGNAKTVLNNNSSRFGKFTKMLFSLDKKADFGKVVGSFIETYLLEKSRVVRQPLNERNYHIFYQMLKGLDIEQLKELGCDIGAKKFHYLNQWHCEEIQGISDKGRFQETVAGMNMLSFDDDLKQQIWKILAAILHIGNVEFRPDQKVEENAAIVSSPHVEKAAQLLGLPTNALRRRLLTRNIKVGGKIIIKPLSPRDAIANRDALAKGMFSGLFDWIVKRINSILYDEDVDPDFDDQNEFKVDNIHEITGEENCEDGVRFIGILDVFGFECFVHNSFEQFCINFANERLQNFFNEHIIRSEQEEYLKEGIYWTPVEVPDNSDTIDLVKNKSNGVFSVLEAACDQPGGTDLIFTQSLFDIHKNHIRLKRERHASTKKNKSGQMENINGFSIAHYAQVVIYNAAEFLVKNTDRTHVDSVELFSTSSLDVAKEILISTVQTKGSRGKRVQTVGGQFAMQLDNLMKHLSQTYPYFVRCINPNDRKQARYFIPLYVEHQLRCGGLIEALRILKCGYPTRASYSSLWQRYGHILQPQPSHINHRDFCEAILVSYQLEPIHYEMGLTKVFFRPEKQSFLEDIIRKNRFSLPEAMLIKIRTFLCRKRVVRLAACLHSYGRFALRLRRIRAQRLFAKSVRVTSYCKQSLCRLLEFVRARSASVAIQSAFRSCLIISWKRQIVSLASFIQKWWRHHHRRHMLVHELNIRIEAKRLERERRLLEEAELRKLQAEREAQARKEKALRSYISTIVAHQTLIAACIDAIARWCSSVLNEVVIDSTLMKNLQTGVLLCRIIKALQPDSNIKIHPKATLDSFFAKDNLTSFFEAARLIGLDESLFFEVEKASSITNEVFVNLLINLIWFIHSGEVFKPSHISFRYSTLMELCLVAVSQTGDPFVTCFGESGIIESMDEDLCKQFLNGRKRVAVIVKPIMSSGNQGDDVLIKKSAIVDEKKVDRPVKEAVETKEQLVLEPEKQPKVETETRPRRHSRRHSYSSSESESESEEERHRRHRRRKHRKQAKNVVPAVDPMEQFFCMTHAAVLTKLEEEGRLDNFNISTSKELYSLANQENVGWHEYHDWLVLQLAAPIRDDSEEDEEEEEEYEDNDFDPDESYMTSEIQLEDIAEFRENRALSTLDLRDEIDYPSDYFVPQSRQSAQEFLVEEAQFSDKPTFIHSRDRSISASFKPTAPPYPNPRRQQQQRMAGQQGQNPEDCIIL